MSASATEHAAPPRVGVNLAGYFESVLGTGEAARLVRDALEAAGVPVASYTLREHEPAALAPRERYPVSLVCANADELPSLPGRLGGEFFAARRRIGLWWWEVAAFPERWRRSFDHLDEIWVGSHFVADALAAVSPVPVVRMPQPVAAPRPAPLGRAELGLPDGFLFLYSYDYRSVAERKNPLGAIEAFRRAFGGAGEGGPRLVLKSIGSEHAADAHRRVSEAAAAVPGVHQIDGELPVEHRDALVAACDCYLSPHRSEGLGLTIVEAMLAGKPVIATGYGGPRDYLTPANSYLVDHSLVPVGPGNDPYPPDALWADPDLDQAAELMRAVVEHPEQASARGERARADAEREFSLAAAGAAMARRLDALHALPAPAIDRARELEALVRSEPATGAPGARGALRRVLLRATRARAERQRQVDEQLIAWIRSLEEEVHALRAAYETLAERVREEDERYDA